MERPLALVPSFPWEKEGLQKWREGRLTRRLGDDDDDYGVDKLVIVFGWEVRSVHLGRPERAAVHPRDGRREDSKSHPGQESQT